MARIKEILKKDITLLLVGSSMAFAGTPTPLEQIADIKTTNNYVSYRSLSYADDVDNGDLYGSVHYHQ